MSMISVYILVVRFLERIRRELVILLLTFFEGGKTWVVFLLARVSYDLIRYVSAVASFLVR